MGHFTISDIALLHTRRLRTHRHALDYNSVNLASFRTPHPVRPRRLRTHCCALDYDFVKLVEFPLFRAPRPLAIIVGKPTLTWCSHSFSSIVSLSDLVDIIFLGL
jgi:hypothetical protein